MLTRSEARKAMLSIKDTREGAHFGKPSVFYGEDFLGRVHDKEEAVALRVGSIEMRDVMLEAEPKLFYITDHYKSWPMLLARLKALNAETLRELVAARIREIDAQPKKKSRKPAQKSAAKKTVKKKAGKKRA
ncbi:MAG TPA: hypothetical protein VIJ72_00550 [Rhizomicrobium sp.]